MDEEISKNKTVIARKFGAGNGGFFLVFSEKNKLNLSFKKENKC